MSAVAVVGIGASAGGIEAFRRFFGTMPPDSGLGFVVVLHRGSTHKSMLAEIIARWTPMKVAEADDGVPIVANEVLVVPGGMIARLANAKLTLLPVDPDARAVAAPIDAFFDSMAADLREAAVGIILSGTGHDGALGLKAIKAQGGLTLAQGKDGSVPDYSGMPESAFAAGAVDLLVPVEQMAQLIMSAFPGPAPAADPPPMPAGSEDIIRRAICEVIRSRLGHDFSEYKRQTFMRRVQRRMQSLQMTDFGVYLERLRNDREQVVLLFRDLLISVTSFFRDTAAFDAMARTIIPRLFQGKDANGEVRIWVPGCATGEEVYSLAILMREHMDALSVVPKVQIFASDIDEVGIATARAGRYPATLLDGLSPERRARFFSEGPSGFTVRQMVRELCSFSAHSLIRDPPFSRIDMVSCRNLLIYLDSDLQDRIIPVFHYALVPNGVLVLGASETITHHENLFAPLDRAHRIFVRQDAQSEAPMVAFTTSRDLRLGPGIGSRLQPDHRASWARAVGYAQRRVLDGFSAPFVVVNERGEVAHFSNGTGRFLEPPAGAPTINLFEMARRGWSLELRTLLRRCIESGRPVEQVGRAIDAAEGTPDQVRLVAEPLPSPDDERLFLVIFVDVSASRQAVPLVPDEPALIAQLERENIDLREQLRSVAEEHATAVEELRSANEELQSVNEELQSTNEELETSREEIQSINEELNTVNVQLSGKVEELGRANSDLRNLFDSTKVATVFLDPHLIIRNFTPEIASIYNLIPSDHGRPLSDIVSRLSYSSLRQDVGTVLRTLVPLEKRVERTDGTAHYLMRILPYRSPDSSVDGSLITFVDVTSIVRAEQHQRLLVDELNHRVKNMLTVVISLATNTLRRAESMESFSQVFLGRIHSLTAAYALLSREGWAPVAVRDILLEELSPFMSGDNPNVVLDGSPVQLQPRAALALGLAVHELTTNAVKYGALSVPEGVITVAWSITTKPEGENFVLRWTERNGPPVLAPTRLGFGTTLIERGFAHDVSGDVAIDFAPEGLTATLTAPVAANVAIESVS